MTLPSLSYIRLWMLPPLRGLGTYLKVSTSIRNCNY
ncbi:hypothetical protein V6Z12_A10G078900 [Gossypium hirsutum]